QEASWHSTQSRVAEGGERRGSTSACRRVTTPIRPSASGNRRGGSMRPFVIAVVVWMSVAAHAQTPLPAEYCPAGASPPSCGFLPSDENVRRAEVGASKLRYLLLAWYTKCVSKAVLQKSQAGRASFDQCALDAMARGINRFNALESQPSCENFSLIAR